jgi:lipopolysaccharide/colanic/teichoic acid biosynthesis glycosyltransferase
MRRLARLLLYLGTVAAVVGLSKVHAAWIADPPYDYTGSFRFGWSLTYIVLLGVTAYGLGLPDIASRQRSWFGTVVLAPVAAAVAMSVIQLALGDALLPRFVVLGAAVLLVPWYTVCCLLDRSGHAAAESTDRVAFVGSPEQHQELLRELSLAPERPATLVAWIPMGPETQADAGRAIGEPVAAEQATVLVLDRAAQASDEVVAQAASLHERGVRVRTVSLFYEEWLGKLPVADLERVSLMFDIGEVHRVRYGRLKRLVDVALGLLGLVPLALIIVPVFVANLAFNRGPLFYRQPRVGKNGSVFQIWKLRTMRPSEQSGGAWTAEDDPRITPLGHLLRVSHLDELPQVLNIVAGNLSVVGPRPEQPHYVAELQEKLPFYDLRHLVSPGLTGWAQVKYGYAGDERDALEKLQYDFYYLRRQSLSLDLRIVGRTVRSVLGRGGR